MNATILKETAALPEWAKYDGRSEELEIEYGGVRLKISTLKSSGRIFLSWESNPRREEVAFVPATHQQAYLVAKENMR